MTKLHRIPLRRHSRKAKISVRAIGRIWMHSANRIASLLDKTGWNEWMKIKKRSTHVYCIVLLREKSIEIPGGCLLLFSWRFVLLSLSIPVSWNSLWWMSSRSFCRALNPFPCRSAILWYRNRWAMNAFWRMVAVVCIGVVLLYCDGGSLNGAKGFIFLY